MATILLDGGQEAENGFQFEKPGTLDLTRCSNGDRPDQAFGRQIVEFGSAEARVELQAPLRSPNPNGA